MDSTSFGVKYSGSTLSFGLMVLFRNLTSWGNGSSVHRAGANEFVESFQDYYVVVACLGSIALCIQPRSYKVFDVGTLCTLKRKTEILCNCLEMIDVFRSTPNTNTRSLKYLVKVSD